MTYDAYRLAIQVIRQLVKRMNDADIPLSAISSPDGLDAALRSMFTRNFMDSLERAKLGDSPYYSRIITPNELRKVYLK